MPGTKPHEYPQKGQARLRNLLGEVQRILESEPVSESLAQRCTLLIEEALSMVGDGPPPVTHHLRSRLTQRELQIATAIGTAMSNSEIAERLFISVNTVRFHTGNILRKLGAKNRIEVAAIVSRWEMASL